MDTTATDLNRQLMLDANAAAGLLEEVFSAEMTAASSACAACGREGQVGSLLAFTLGPGIVLRCPACEQVVLRIARTPEGVFLDARGAVYLRWSQPAL